MAENKQNNIFTVQGIIYAKNSRLVKSKKDDKEYEFKSIILELKREHQGKTYIDLPEFQLGFGVADDGFDEGDFVQLTFSLAGKKVSNTWHKTDLKALYIKHPDLVGNDTRDVAGTPLAKQTKKDEVFVAPDPADEEDLSDLPF
jgi:hypothetical protein